MSELRAGSAVIEQALAEEGVWASNTFGSSMRPLLRQHKDMVIILPLEGEARKYDVLLYHKPNGAYTLHRVVGVTVDSYLIRGDNTFILERVPKDKIIGILSEINRGGKIIRVTDGSYRFYSRVWNFIYPVRWLIYKLRRGLGRLYRAVFKKK